MKELEKDVNELGKKFDETINGNGKPGLKENVAVIKTKLDSTNTLVRVLLAMNGTILISIIGIIFKYLSERGTA
jgi:hypothetical protein